MNIKPQHDLQEEYTYSKVNDKGDKIETYNNSECLMHLHLITSSTIPHSNLNKRDNALSYHCIGEAIAANILCLIHINGKLNPSDVLTKFLSSAKFWPLIQPFLFWKGETIKETHPNTPITAAISQLTSEAPSGE
jgi:hypothetical protein